MDFLTLPRRDLQALCKRNGVRANMTNAAMADALRALPKVDGIDEYVKQPVLVPEPEVEAVVEEQNTGKQGSPLRRGRRGVAKSSEPIDLEEDNEEEKGNAQRQSNKEDAQAIGVGWRGASRRARPVPVVPQPAAVAEDDSQGEEDLKREAERHKAPGPVVGRRGGSRRARPSLAVAAPAAESEVAGAEEEQREEVEDHKREASMDDVPPLGVGRRGASRRARPAPSVAALACKAVMEEEQRDPIPRGRRVKAMGSSTEPIMLGDSDDEEKDDAKPEEQQEEAQILGVGRRGGASRRGLAAPAADKAEEEQRALVPSGRRVKAMSTELIRLDDSKEEKKEDTKPEEDRGDAPAIGVGRRGASRRAPAPSEASATRRSAAASKAEAGDVAVEDVPIPIRATRQRKPTMKAAAAAAAAVEEKAPRRATRRGAVMSTLLQEVQEESQEVVGAPDVAVEAVLNRATRQRKPTMKEAAAATAEEKAPPRATRRGAVMTTVLQKEVQEEPQEVVGAPDVAVEAVPNRATRQRKPTMKVAAAATEEEKVPPRATRRGAVMTTVLQEEVQEEPQEAVGAPVSCQRCDSLEELEEASDPQKEKEELNEVDAPKQDEGEDVVIIENKKLMEETTAEDPPVTDQECTDKSEFQEQQVDNEKYHHASLAIQVESPILGLVSVVTEQASEDDEGANFQDGGGSSAGLLDKGVREETSYAGEEMELVPGVPALQAPLTANESDDNHESEIGTVREEISEVDTTDDEVCKEKEHEDIAELQADILDEAAFLDCSGNISQVAGDKTIEEVSTENGLGCQEEGDVVVDKVLHDSVDNTILDCSSDISWVEVEKAGNTTSEMTVIQAALDEDGEETTFYVSICDADKLNGVVISDSMSQATMTDEVVQEEKGVLIADEMPQGRAGMHDDMEDDQFETVFVQADQVATAGNLPEQVTDCEITVEVNTSMIVDETQHSTVTMDEDVVEDHSEADGGHSNEQIEVVTTDKVPELKLIEDVFVQADQVVTTDNLPEQVTDCEITEENTALIVDESQQSTVTMDEDVEKTPSVFDEKQKSTVTKDKDVVHAHSKTDVVHADEQMEVSTTYKVPELTVEVAAEMKTPLIVDEKQPSTVTMNGDIVDDHFKTHVAHADEQKEVVATEVPEVTGTVPELTVEVAAEMKTPLIVDEKQPSTVTMNGDIVDDHFKTHVSHADEQKEVVATEVPEVTGTDSEIEEKTPLIVDEEKQSTVTMDGDVPFDHLKTDTAHADEQKEMTGIVTEVPDEVTGTDDEIVEERAFVITEDIPNQGAISSTTHTIDGCVKENHFGTDFGHGNEQKKAITADTEPEVSRAQDEGARKENALLGDVTKSLSKGIITMEPLVCKNSSNINTAEPMAVLEEKGVKVAIESEDLTKLSLGQLKAMLKEKLNAKKNKEAKKRVALARVDENVCRSHAKEQQQNVNLQQH